MSDNKMFNEKIFKIIEKDKKNDNEKIKFVLLKKIGSAFLSNNLNLDKIKKNLK
jgi:3-dehydroquinate synthetase